MTSPAELRRVWLDDEPGALGIRAGRFSATLVGDSLSDIRFDGRAVLTAIRFVVRDHDWSTVPAEVVAVDVESDPHRPDAGLRLGIRAQAGDGPELEWTARVEVDGDRLHVSASAVVLRPFRRNRIGIVLLHPPSCAGAALTVRHTEGETRTRFPVGISPHQPAVDIVGLEWASAGVRTRVDLEGDVFEMEDQRNWTDASFKTYGTPLSVPFPVEVGPGGRIDHAVTITCAAADTAAVDNDTEDEGSSAAADGRSRTVLRLARSDGRMPAILVGASTAPDAAGTDGVGRPDWLGCGVLVELRATDDNWRAVLERAEREAGAGVLDVRIVASDAREVDTVLSALTPGGARRIDRLGVYALEGSVTEPALWRALVDGMAASSLSAELVGGARSHFTELNRRHEALPEDVPALTFSITPQMHDVGRTQVVESLGMQRLVVEQAVRIAAGRPVHVGPITLRSRYNAVATTPPEGIRIPDLQNGYGAHLVAGATDPRQRGWGYAAWVIASASALSVDGVVSLTFAESWGPRGFLDAAGRFPASWAIEWLTALGGRPRVAVTGPIPPSTAVLGAEADGSTVLLVANASSEAHEFDLAVGESASGRLERLSPGADDPVVEDSAARGGVLRIRVVPGGIARWIGRDG
ncbi:hypothetical protein [Planctomonas psychrotolerans]|uniref:hypothetical protein n=1 Tax=Planctomonas psychrotolerans TaxID=2528712 RepID=UPI00123A4AF0|nr:hypothetical protein [Planctomonas psychrotolerans]